MNTKHKPWIGVDLDGTSAVYTTWKGHQHIGAPIEAMVKRIRFWRSQNVDVRIFTARVYPLNTCIEPGTKFPAIIASDETYKNAVEAVRAIQEWCLKHLGEVLPVTNVKDFSMIKLYDDRARQVIPNTGYLLR